jgi:hypothetical protein
VPTPSSYVVTWRSFDGEETLEFANSVTRRNLGTPTA